LMLSPDQRRRNRSEERKSFQDRGSRSEVDASSSQAISPEELELISTTPDRSFYHQAIVPNPVRVGALMIYLSPRRGVLELFV
jgi:hypothetical protein